MSDIRARLQEVFAPWMTNDLSVYLDAVGGMFEEVELYASETDEWEGWSILFDPYRCPAEALPYLAQLVGEQLPAGLDEAKAREWVADAPNLRRGTPESIYRVARRWLTGQKAVQLREREGETIGVNVDYVTVITYNSETPDPAALYNDLRRNAVPAELVLNYQHYTGQIWENVRTEKATWADVLTDWPTWDIVRVQTPGD